MRGESLLPLLEDPGASRPVYAEGVLYGASERSYTDGGWKLLLDDAGRRAALFDIERDPLEQVDLSHREPERLARFDVSLVTQVRRLHEQEVHEPTRM